MAKPTYFKFFDGYVETLRSCKTHKDRSILLMAMFDFWDNGTVPDLPEYLQDKWRFLYNSLKVSRQKSYEKLGEDTEKTEQEKSTDPSSSVSESLESPADNQQITSNRCPVTTQPSFTYRIENKGIKNKEKDNDSIKCTDSTLDNNTVGLSLSCPSVCPSSINIDEEWREASEAIIQERISAIERGGTEKDGPNYKSTNDQSIPTSPRTSSCPSTDVPRCTDIPAKQDNTQHTSHQSTETQKPHFAQSEIETAAVKVLECIKSKFRQYAAPVRFTRVDANDELGLDKHIFYEAIKYLESSGSITITKTTAPDGKTVNRYTPTAMDSDVMESNLVVFGPTKGTIKWTAFGFSINDYFMHAPFCYRSDWDYETFAQHNIAHIQLAEEQMPGLSTRPGAYCQELWSVIAFYKTHNFDIVPYHE